MGKKIIKSIVCGFAESVILFLVNEYIMSIYFETQPLKVCFILSAFGALLSAIIYLVLFLKEHINKRFILETLVTGFAAISFGVILFMSNISGYFGVFPTRETNNADGILIILSSVTYIVLLLAFKLISFFVIFCRNVKTEDGYLS